MKRFVVSFFLFFSASMLLLAGCAPTKQAIYLDAGFQPEVINQITLLPVADARIEKKTKENFEGYILGNAMRILQKKGYQVRLSDNIGEISQITEGDLKSGDSEWIKRLGPPDARYVMVVVLVSVGTGFHGFGSSGGAEVAGYLYNKDNGTMVWRDMGRGSVQGQGGFIGLATKSSLSWNAITVAMKNLLSTIPKRPLVKDNKETSTPQVSVQTEGEQSSASPEKLSQEQTQQKEASKDSGIISITSDPPGAKIFIDGEFKGQTPAEISLSTGTYQIFLQRQLYEPYKESVVIEKGQTKTLNIRLSPEGKEQK
jgi:hypothetical protein